MSERRVRIGGLLRCCIQSAAEYEGPEVPGETVIGCKYHDDPDEPQCRIAADGNWEWVGPAAAPVSLVGEPGEQQQ